VLLTKADIMIVTESIDLLQCLELAAIGTFWSRPATHAAQKSSDGVFEPPFTPFCDPGGKRPFPTAKKWIKVYLMGVHDAGRAERLRELGKPEKLPSAGITHL
jgi:hypothetical protein